MVAGLVKGIGFRVETFGAGALDLGCTFWVQNPEVEFWNYCSRFGIRIGCVYKGFRTMVWG